MLIVILIIILLLLYFLNIQRFLNLNEVPKKTGNILFMVRDGEKYLQKNLNEIIIFCKEVFKEYKILFIENDSKDNTKNILTSMMQENNNIIGEFKGITKKTSEKMCNTFNIFNITLNKNCNSRTRFLASLRQELLNKSMDYPSDLTIMIDMDFVSFDTSELIKMINKLTELHADGIFGMSYTTINTPYDTGSIKPSTILLNPALYKKNNVIKVDSAFSGFGVYNTESIKKYHAEYSDNAVNIEHIHFNKQLKKLYIYTSFNPIY
jgi:hypothetical protein